MAIQRGDPLRDLQQLQERVKRLFDEALSGASSPAGVAVSWKPPTDVLEEPERFVVRADLPGVGPEEVEVVVERGCLVLRGQRKREEQPRCEGFLRLERPTGPFSVHIALPPSVDPRGIEANHRNGVLEVVLPKRREDAPARIRVGGGP